jgi:hypothetical protein
MSVGLQDKLYSARTATATFAWASADHGHLVGLWIPWLLTCCLSPTRHITGRKAFFPWRKRLADELAGRTPNGTAVRRAGVQQTQMLQAMIDRAAGRTRTTENTWVWKYFDQILVVKPDNSSIET